MDSVADMHFSSHQDGYLHLCAVRHFRKISIADGLELSGWVSFIPLIRPVLAKSTTEILPQNESEEFEGGRYCHRIAKLAGYHVDHVRQISDVP